MTSKLFLTACFAGLLSLPGATLVQAQTSSSGPTPTPPKAITPEAHRNATNGGTIQSGMVSALGQKATPNSTFTGWHYFHATTCDTYWDGVTTWVYVYPSEGGYWFTSNDLFANTFLNQCTVGNWVAIYVYDTAGDFSQVYTYDYK